ncbi:MAG TPA: GAF domain-containing SpoIIE family protein phosphatase [Planctomycetaceae bacterium]|jgi:serine phosphatase RsbU (regulator of sigma subunit)|nr:GAF domain-containing SpoIIE family protein phosphatase [Planctomycetaceae bacterium]
MSGELSNLTAAHAAPEQQDALLRLLDVTCELARHHTLDQILQTVTTGACEALGCERASLYLYDADRNEVYTRAVTELELEEIRSSTDRGITGWVVRNRALANIPDPAADSRWNAGIDRQTGFHTRNILAAPIITSTDDRLLGVLQLLNKHGGSFGPFDEQVIRAFAAHAATALERASLVADAKLSHELQLAVNMGRRIQSSFLPRCLPEIPGYEVGAWWRPAELVSGDYYDIVPLRDGRLGLLVADVSGHGVGPSLLMASVRAMVHVLTRRRTEPGEIVPLLAETISPDLEGGTFLTMLMVALDPQTHELTYVNAGHGPALLFHRDTRTFQSLKSTGLPLGFISDFSPIAGLKLTMGPGDLLILATDGLIELLNDANDMFGRPRLEQLIQQNCTLAAPDLVMAIQDEIAEFLGDSQPLDDVTLMVVERKLG